MTAPHNTTLAENTIHLGDCLDLMRLIPDKSIDLVLTDPPYGMGFQSNYRIDKHSKISNDDNLDWLPVFYNEVFRVLKDEGIAYIFCSFHFVDQFKLEAERFYTVKNILIWMKNNTGMGDLYGDYAPQYEMVLFFNKSNKPLNNGRDSNILRFKRTDNALHPTQKPIPLFEFLIEKSTITNDLILDPFSGSGTTAIAAHNLGRRFICIEKDEDYHAASVQRLKDTQAQLRLF